MSEFVLDFFEGKNLATIEKKKYSYLMIDGHDQADIYILKDGIVKTSIILSDGREFNIMYLKGFDVLSLLKEKFLSENEALRDYVDTYYRKKLSEAIYRQQLMTMNGKNGAVCAFIYYLVELFGRKVKKGIFIDLQVTNDDIAGFCGVSTRNSVNRILRGLRQQGVITMVYHKILVLDVDYLKRYV